MARTTSRPEPTTRLTLETCHDHCWICGGALWVAYHNRRTVQTLAGLVRLKLPVRRCRNPACERYRTPYRPEAEGSYALPHGEFGLDVIAFVGRLRYQQHQRVLEIHQAPFERGVGISERSVTEQLYRYEEMLARRLADHQRLQSRLAEQRQIILALDGLQPDVGHEVLWVLRDCLSGEILLARSLLRATEADLAPLITEVRDALPVPIRGVISDGQRSIRRAVASALPGVPHQRCQFHYLREAARPIYEADRHAKTQLKKQVRGVRPIERTLEARDDAEAQAVRGYCLAVRSALTDDGRAPLSASGLILHDRLTAIAASIERVREKGGPGVPMELARLERIVTSGLVTTAADWPAIRQADAWIHCAAHLLRNPEERDVLDLRREYRRLLAEMRRGQAALGTLAPTVTHVRKVTRS